VTCDFASGVEKADRELTCQTPEIDRLPDCNDERTIQNGIIET